MRWPARNRSTNGRRLRGARTSTDERRVTAQLPTGTVTFLFSDVEGSTELLRRLRDRYAEVMADHERLLRSAFQDSGGHEINTQGDSFFVAFRKPKDAVGAAVDA
ncbi:MAG: adenylate/guanylate cyclase domain-containing protein, partial [Actinobacteria bacterium]